MTAAGPGVWLRHQGEAAPRARLRKRPEPQGPYAEECADAEMALADERKLIGMRSGRRGRR